MLSKKKILEAFKDGSIYISNFDEEKLGSISYDMTIDNIVKVYTKTDKIYDTRISEPKPDHILDLSENNIILHPGNLYLANTKEEVYSKKFIPCITGRSSFARLGIQVHQTAFFANPGHKFKWVLEISSILPVAIHKNDLIAQMYFEQIEGDLDEDDLYHGKYAEENLIGFKK